MSTFLIVESRWATTMTVTSPARPLTASVIRRSVSLSRADVARRARAVADQVQSACDALVASGRLKGAAPFARAGLGLWDCSTTSPS